MKKMYLIFVLIAGACQLKAQQLFHAKPADSLLTKYLQTKPDNLLLLLKPLPKFNAVLNDKLAKKPISSVDHMPVAILDGNSKMPAVKIGGYYTMPVKRIGSEDPSLTGQGVLPQLPTFKTP